MQKQTPTMVFILALGLASQVDANDVKTNNNAIQPSSSLNGNSAQIMVTGPNGFTHSENRAGGDTFVSIERIKPQKNGVYQYEFIEPKVIGKRKINDDFNGRGKSVQKIVESKTVSGHFRINDDVIVNEQLKEASTSRRSIKPSLRPRE